TSEKADTERIGFLIDECKKMDIEVLAPDINESFRNFSVIPGINKIRFGLLAIKNVGENIVDAVIVERKTNGPYQSISDFINRIDCKVINRKSMESFAKAGVFDRFSERNQLLYNLDRILEYSRERQKNILSGQKSLFGGKNFNSEIVLDQAPPAEKSEKLNWEKELLGLFVTSHPLESYRKVLEKHTTRIAELDLSLNYNHYGQISIGGLVSNVKKIITKNGKPMLFAKIEDLTDKIEVVVFPKVMEKNPDAFAENKIVFVRGKLDNRDGVKKIICDYVEEIKEI
ncbi:MAG: OB-fold nucleic acid binding domain-containing protein, partial [Patescibacteria group bacterium]